MALQREYARPDNERVTAGIPSLTSDKRQAVTNKHLHRIYQDELVAEYRTNDEAARKPTDNQRPMTVAEAQRGIPLTSGQIIKRLIKLNSNLHFEVSKADGTKMGVYRKDPDPAKEPHYIAGFEVEMNNEFTMVKEVLVFGGETMPMKVPGWRDVLMKLIRTGLITEAGAYAMFGPPNRDSERWALFTQ